MLIYIVSTSLIVEVLLVRMYQEPNVPKKRNFGGTSPKKTNKNLIFTYRKVLGPPQYFFFVYNDIVRPIKIKKIPSFFLIHHENRSIIYFRGQFSCE